MIRQVTTQNDPAYICSRHHDKEGLKMSEVSGGGYSGGGYGGGYGGGFFSDRKAFIVFLILILLLLGDNL